MSVASGGRRSIGMRIALLHAAAGAGVSVLLLMAALATGFWQPARRMDVLVALLAGPLSAAALLALVGHFIARQALAPARQMVERARRLSASSLRERLPVHDPGDELGELATIFNDVLDRLEASFGELRRFAADASHELRTPLTAIRAVGEVGLDERDPERLREVVGSMLEEVGRMNQLIDRLLLVAQADDDGVPVRVLAGSLRASVLEVADYVGVLAADKEQRLEIGAQDVVALFDPDLLRLALLNLVQNAIRYSPAGTRIAVRVAERGGEAIVEVEDEGCGIALEHHGRVFERFYRVDKSRSRSDGGTGLGLAIVKWAVLRMHGGVEFDSEVGRGSVFRLRLPRPAAPRAAVPEPAGESVDAPVLPLHEAAAISAAEVCRRLGTAPDGLPWSEAARRLRVAGPNAVALHGPPSTLKLLWHAANNPFNAVLLVLGIVSLATRDVMAAAVMGTMITLSTTLRFWQERKSLIESESLRRLVRNTATVARRGESPAEGAAPSPLHPGHVELDIEELVPGDVVRLSAGDMIPADLRLLDSRDLFVTQATLTGESQPVEKRALSAERGTRAAGSGALDEPTLLFMGSSVVSGTGTAVAIATGESTHFGALAKRLMGKRPRTAFDLGVNRVSALLIRFMVVLVPVVFFVNGLLKGEWTDAFFFAIAVAVGLTPEMLPMIVNANLARGALALSRQNTIVRQLSALQNLGAMDVLCTDKTGTLTEDRVVLIRHIDAEGRDSVRVLEHAFLNSSFQTGLKNLLDRAVVDHARTLGLAPLLESFRKVDELPFDFHRRRMSVVLDQASGVRMLVCKGAVEEMLDICTQFERGDGVLPLDATARETLRALRDRAEDEGQRVVAVGYRALGPHDPLSEATEGGLTFVGFVCFVDPPKDSAAEALRRLAANGVAVRIVTGDSPATARRICRDVGLAVERVVTGAEIERMSEEALAEAARGDTLFARVSPDQKAAIVRALRSRGRTVGFMGDGVNDANALREADVGISVDTGVDVAREAADVILLEKSLLVLDHAVREGRRTFGNIVKYIKMTASSNFGNVLSVVVASALLPFLPMLPIQLLVQNLLYDASQMAIPWDRMDREFVRRPRPWEARSIGRFMLCFGPLSSVFDLAMFAALWFALGASGIAGESLFQSGWFVHGLLTQLLIVHIIRTERIPFVQSTATLPVLVMTAVVAALGLWLPFSVLAPTFGLQPLPADYFPWLVGIVVGYCIATQWAKQFYVRRFGSLL